MTQSYSIYMDRALELARAAAEAGEVPVGAVIVDPSNGEIIGEGQNLPIAKSDPTGHAEIVAIRQAARAIGNYRLAGYDLYVTLEPCTMCAGAISFSRLRKLVFAASDEKGGAVISGVRFFDSPTCHWSPEVEQDEFAAPVASTLLKSFFKARRG